MFREGPDGFRGGLSAENYIAITGTSRATATRDLQDLVEMGGAHANRRAASYPVLAGDGIVLLKHSQHVVLRKSSLHNMTAHTR